jgi:hypothetical protein
MHVGATARISQGNSGVTPFPTDRYTANIHSATPDCHYLAHR